MSRALKILGDGLEVAASPIHGRGLRSVRARRAGDAIYRVRGESVSAAFDEHYAQGENWIGIGWERWLVAEHGNPMRFTNHACDPNAIVAQGLLVVALRDIPPGGEIAIDYATTEVDPNWRFRCCCGSRHCRRQVRSFTFLPKILRARYARYLPTEFLAAARRVECARNLGM